MPQPGPSGIAGTVSNAAGTLLSGAYVYAYRSSKSGLRGPADFEAETGPDGRYFLDLVEGDYHLVARMRHGRSDSGPPRAGDAWAPYLHNPISVIPHHTSRADFVLQTVIRQQMLGKTEGSREGTGVTGRLVDRQGLPVPAAIALAYTDEDLHRMPDYASAAADQDGRFLLPVGAAGRYCLAARTKTRGQPQPGELYGIYHGPDGSACVEVEPGKMNDIGKIILEPYRQ